VTTVFRVHRSTGNCQSSFEARWHEGPACDSQQTGSLLSSDMLTSNFCARLTAATVRKIRGAYHVAAARYKHDRALELLKDVEYVVSISVSSALSRSPFLRHFSSFSIRWHCFVLFQLHLKALESAMNPESEKQNAVRIQWHDPDADLESAQRPRGTLQRSNSQISIHSSTSRRRSIDPSNALPIQYRTV
jgi:hypothetical protein